MFLLLLFTFLEDMLTNAQPPCDYRLLLSNDGDLPSMPISVRTDVAADAQQCAFACNAQSSCKGFNYLPAGIKCSLLPSCPYAGGCCWLKSNASTAASSPIKGGDGCADACSFIMRSDSSSLPPLPPSPPLPSSIKNVLYLLVDDMRPDASPWGASFMNTPNLAKLASQSTVFTRAYCNIAVCSPSRQSFLTGRYPTHTGVFNFINHFRQADCSTSEEPDASFGQEGSPLSKTILIYDGGSGQCCSFCSTSDTCQGWTLNGRNCTLFDSPPSSPIPSAGSISGRRGSTIRSDFITLPQYFLNAGYFTLGTGKVFHTEEGGSGPAPFDGPGTGMPPLQDPLSWSRNNASMVNVNSLAPMRPCEGGTCSIPANINGDPDDPKKTFRFCDRIIGDDAVMKLRAASDNFNITGQPFFLAVGFRKPHLPFRHPSAFDTLYPAPADISLAKHKTMNVSIPPVAFHETSLASNPYVPLDDLQAGTLRRDYYSAISWMDSQIGRVIDELESLGLVNDTALVFHADHGWSLGENGEWEKFTVWETGTRVPLLVRAPWLNRGGGVSNEIVELVDVFPTIANLAGLVEPEGIDGSSLVPAILRTLNHSSGNKAEPILDDKVGEDVKQRLVPLPSHGDDVKQRLGPLPPHAGAYALSIYPRCPADLTNSSNFWKNNDCLLIERTKIPIMGLSIRVENWRYTEYRWWLPNLSPDWERSPVGIELFSHEGDLGDIDTYDTFEVVNLAGMEEYVEVEAALSLQLSNAYKSL
jgi:arylsulfatase A-like enzyme